MFLRSTCRHLFYYGGLSLSFVYAQTKLSPRQSTTVPHLKLCAAVLSTQAVKPVLEELNIKIEKVTYYTDSKVVLAYIQNETRRFYAYVANRIQTIRKLSASTQWEYVETHCNPADLATRGLSVQNLTETAWLNGPEFLRNPAHREISKVACCLEADDPELRPANACLATKICERRSLDPTKFVRFSHWLSLRRALATLILGIRRYRWKKSRIQKMKSQRAQANANDYPRRSLELLKQAEQIIVKTVQTECFADEILEP